VSFAASGPKMPPSSMENLGTRSAVTPVQRSYGKNRLDAPYVGGLWRRLLKSYRPRNRAKKLSPLTFIWALLQHQNLFPDSFRVVFVMSYLIEFSRHNIFTTKCSFKTTRPNIQGKLQETNWKEKQSNEGEVLVKKPSRKVSDEKRKKRRVTKAQKNKKKKP